MSDSQGQPWSDNPNAPKITHEQYFREKANFAGTLIGAILYGIVIMLFFQCMTSLLSPIHRRGEPIKWGFVSFTAAMFSIVTVLTAMNLNNESSAYIDNRAFPGAGDVFPSGPLGYQWFIHSKARGIIPNLMFFLNNWLADSLLLYRCYVIYSRKAWAIALPSLMYLACVAMGILLIYQASRPDSGIWNTLSVEFGLPYFSISIALNILLTLMIVIRLVLYGRNIHAAMGTPPGIGGLYKAVVAMLIESSALYAVNSLLFVGPWGAKNHAADIFLPILAQTQVIAPLLILRRVANNNALSSNTVVSGTLGEFKARSRGEVTGASSTLPGGYPMYSMDRYGKLWRTWD